MSSAPARSKQQRASSSSSASSSRPSKRPKSSSASSSHSSPVTSDEEGDGGSEERKERGRDEGSDLSSSDIEERERNNNRDGMSMAEKIRDNEEYLLQLQQSEDREMRGGGHKRRGREGPAAAYPSSSSSSSPPASSVFSESGIIERIELRNFMTHENFAQSFGPHINIIAGHNGAGKSALLSAIQVVFGCSGLETNRGRGLSDLICWGKERAEVTIYIKNKGEDAFRPDIYGDSIGLQRMLTARTSTFKMMDKSGKWKKVNRSMVSELASFFNIQVTNPCVLLDQNQSKKFLNSRNSSDKYDFYLKATQLDVWFNKLQEIKRRIGEMEEILTFKKNELAEIKCDLDEKEVIIAARTQLENKEQMIEEKKTLLAWSEVFRREEEVSRQEMSIKEAEEDVARITLQVEEMRGSASSLLPKRAEKERKINELREKVEEQAREVAALQHSITALSQRLTSVHKEEEVRKRALKDVERALTEQTKKVEALVAESLRDKKKEEEERRKRLQAMEEEVEALQREKEGLEGERRAHSKELEEQQAQLSLCRREQQRAAEERERALFLLRQMSEREGGKEGYDKRRFGSFAPEIARAVVSSRHLFSSPSLLPLGPIGNYVRLSPSLEKEWVAAVESCLGTRLLTGYLVPSAKDEGSLRRIFEEVLGPKRVPAGQWPQITVCKFAGNKYFTAEGYKARFPSVFSGSSSSSSSSSSPRLIIDCVDVDLAPVFNHLVDLAHIERSFLSDSYDAGEAQLKRAFPVLQQCYLKNGSSVQAKGGMAEVLEEEEEEEGDGWEREGEGRRRPHVQPSIISRPRPATLGRMQADEKEELQRHKQTAERAQTAEDVHARERVKLEKRVEEERRKSAAIRDKVVKIAGKIEAKQREIERAAEEGREGLASSLEEEMALAREEVKRFENEREEQRMLLKQLQPLIEEKKKEIEEEERKKRQKKEKMDILRNQMATEEQELEALLADEKSRATEALRLSQRLNRRQMDGEEQRKKLPALQQAVEEALSLLPPPLRSARPSLPSLPSVPSLKRDIARLEGEYRQEKRRLDAHFACDIDAVAREAAALRAHYEKAEANLLGAQRLHLSLAAAVRIREAKYASLKLSIVEEAGRQFNYYLGLNKARGNLVADHERRTLELVVNPTASAAAAAAGETAESKSLSGGERSYTTTAFVMALGEAIECPFRAMDEFDVFMDAQNRRLAMELMIKAAKSTKNRQFFFLTPQDVTGLVVSEELRVFKLLAPERGQRQIEFARRNNRGGGDAAEREREREEEEEHKDMQQ